MSVRLWVPAVRNALTPQAPMNVHVYRDMNSGQTAKDAKL